MHSSDSQPLQRLQAASCIFAALGVALGAFGAHALRGKVPESDLAIWNTAVFYHLVHAVGSLLILSLTAPIAPRTRFRIAALMCISICIFAGTLYGIVIFNLRWLGAITPLGGSGFIASWIWAAVEFLRVEKSTPESESR